MWFVRKVDLFENRNLFLSFLEYECGARSMRSINKENN